MNKKSIQNDALNDSPTPFSSAPFRKKNKNRKLPDAFYPRWELELLSSFLLVFIVWILPDWIEDTNDLLSSKYGVEINSTWMYLGLKIVMLGFVISFILRAIWLSLVWKWQSDKSSHGDQMYKNAGAKQMQFQSTQKQKWAMIIDEVAEVLFIITSILFFITMLSYLILVLGSLLKHSSIHPNDIPGTK